MPVLQTTLDRRSDVFRANAEAMRALVADLRAKDRRDRARRRRSLAASVI